MIFDAFKKVNLLFRDSGNRMTINLLVILTGGLTWCFSPGILEMCINITVGLYVQSTRFSIPVSTLKYKGSINKDGYVSEVYTPGHPHPSADTHTRTLR